MKLGCYVFLWTQILVRYTCPKKKWVSPQAGHPNAHLFGGFIMVYFDEKHRTGESTAELPAGFLAVVLDERA